MSAPKIKSTNSQIRPLSLDELEHVSGGTSKTTSSGPVCDFKR